MDTKDGIHNSCKPIAKTQHSSAMSTACKWQLMTNACMMQTTKNPSCPVSSFVSESQPWKLHPVLTTRAAL